MVVDVVVVLVVVEVVDVVDVELVVVVVEVVVVVVVVGVVFVFKFVTVSSRNNFLYTFFNHQKMNSKLFTLGPSQTLFFLVGAIYFAYIRQGHKAVGHVDTKARLWLKARRPFVH